MGDHQSIHDTLLDVNRPFISSLSKPTYYPYSKPLKI
ncbi:uncharacterized protein J3R85_006807 [Psidium guajava]|nr:uncharacterized protein J3R85_006807 [Psidium guajava]